MLATDIKNQNKLILSNRAFRIIALKLKCVIDLFISVIKCKLKTQDNIKTFKFEKGSRDHNKK